MVHPDTALTRLCREVRTGKRTPREAIQSGLFIGGAVERDRCLRLAERLLPPKLADQFRERVMQAGVLQVMRVEPGGEV